MPCYTHKMAVVYRGHSFCEVTSPSPTPKLSSCLSSERRTLWRHFWSYCRVTKSLPSLFRYATRSSSWNWRKTSRTFLHTGTPSATGLLFGEGADIWTRCCHETHTRRPAVGHCLSPPSTSSSKQAIVGRAGQVWRSSDVLCHCDIRRN